MMVPMKEHYISENKTSLFGGNQPTICTYTNVAEIKKKYFHISLSQIYSNYSYVKYIALITIIIFK